jgi:hypothetical protein
MDNPHDPTRLPTVRSEQPEHSQSSVLTRAEAKKQVDYLLSAYPTLKDLHDPEGYLSNLISILLIYAAVDARAGVLEVMNTVRTLPTRFDLRQACERAANDRVRHERLRSLGRVSPPRPRQDFSPEHEAVMRKKIAGLGFPFGPTLGDERHPPDPAPDPLTGKHPPGTILSNHDEAVRLYGPVIGFGDPRHSSYGKTKTDSHQETPETARAKLGLSQAAWDAIPDQPKDAGYWKGVR